MNAKRRKRFIVLFFSDTHGGQTLGLLNPDTIIMEEGPDENGIIQLSPLPVALNASQKYLWDLYISQIDQVKKLAGKDEIIVIHNGDVTQGQKYWDSLLYSSIVNQIIIAEYNMRPMLEIPNVKTMRMTWGTSSHIFGEGTSPTLVQRNLSIIFPKKDIKTVKHGLIDVDGVVIDFAHHGPSKGIRAWLSGNQFRYYLKSIFFDELLADSKPPDVFVRSHFHTRVIEKINEFTDKWGQLEIIGIITPSFTMMNDYGRQATRSKNTVSNGMVAVEIINGEIEKVHWFTETKDIRRKEKLA